MGLDTRQGCPGRLGLRRYANCEGKPNLAHIGECRRWLVSFAKTKLDAKQAQQRGGKDAMVALYTV